MTPTPDLSQTGTSVAPNLVILSGAMPSATDAARGGSVTINPGGGMPAFSVPSSAGSLAGFREWAISESFPEHGQITYSPGEVIIDMSPELFETHNYIKMDVGAALNGLVHKRKLGRFFADRAMFSNEVAQICTEPDGMFISGRSIRSGLCKLAPSKLPGANIEIVGSPDMILEIVSPTSIKKDKEILREAYFRAGVAEYWLIDALWDKLEFQILTPSKDGFASIPGRQEWVASPTFGCSFRLSSAEDEDRFVHYTLHIREDS